MKKLFMTLAIGLGIINFGFAFALPATVHASEPVRVAQAAEDDAGGEAVEEEIDETSAPVDAKTAVCQGLGLTGGGEDCKDPAEGPNVDGVIKTVVNLLSLVVGVVAVIMVIIGGLKYITSSGDSGNITSAKNTILYALIGLVIVALAQVIVRFVLKKVTT